MSSPSPNTAPPVLATCGIRRLGEAIESTPFHRSLLADSSEAEYNGQHSLAYLHQGRTSTVHGILTCFKRMAGHGFQSLHHRFVAWITPDTTSLLLGTLTDQARSKSQLVAENALVRQQLIILRRQVKRPACSRTDRMLLVLLASMVRTWKQALDIIQPETLLRGPRQGFKLFWKDKSRAASYKPRISQATVSLIQEMTRENRLWGAERIRGELLKLSIRGGFRTIQKYMRQVRPTRSRG